MSQGSNFVEDAIDMAVNIEKRKIELAREAYDEASVLRRGILKSKDNEGNIESLEKILGCWYLKSLEIPRIWTRSNSNEDYYFELREDETACVCVNGIKYETIYKFQDSCISFVHAELAAMRLRLKDDELYLNGCLGANLVFAKKAEDEK